MTDKQHEPKVTFMTDDECMKYEEEIEQILLALGHPEALVTDGSMFYDFITCDRDTPTTFEEDTETVDHWLEPLGLSGFCNPQTYLWEAAKLLRMRGCPQ